MLDSVGEGEIGCLYDVFGLVLAFLCACFCSN